MIASVVLLLSLGAPPAKLDCSTSLQAGDLGQDFAQPPLFPGPGDERGLWLSELVGPRAKDGGKLLLLSFGASWCGPCRLELPILERLHRRLKARGLRVLLASLDQTPDGLARHRALIKAAKLSFPAVRLSVDRMARVYLGLNDCLPRSFLLDGELKVLRVVEGLDEAGMRALEAELERRLSPEEESP